MSDIKLTEIAGLRQFWALSVIQVKPRQRRFTKNVLLSWMQSRHPAVSFYRVDLKGTLVGYVMLIHAQEPTQWIIERLTIDQAYQRQGLGYAVADYLIDMVHGFENSEMVIARYEPENVAARKLFDKLNFVQREEMFRDRHVAVLQFEFEEVDDEDDSDEEADHDLVLEGTAQSPGEEPDVDGEADHESAPEDAAQSPNDEVKEGTGDAGDYEDFEVVERNPRVPIRAKDLHEIDPFMLERVVKKLLESMGYANVRVTAPTNDKGVDVVADIDRGIGNVREAIQVKRQQGNVGRGVLDSLRGSLHRFDAVQASIITTGGFTKGAIDASDEKGAAPITLIDGKKLMELLNEHDIEV